MFYKVQERFLNRSVCRLWPAILLLLFSCKEKAPDEGKEGETDKQGIAEIMMENREGEVEFVTRHMEFTGPDTLNSGWNHIKYVNLSSDPHFILLEKFPDSIVLEHFVEEVIPVFQQAEDLIYNGDRENGLQALSQLPPWYSEVVFTGGVGLTSEGEVGRSTLYLEPGRYIMECYLKMPDGKFHSTMGMVKELIVLDEPAETEPPTSVIPVRIASGSGIAFTSEVEAGIHDFAVHFEDQKQYGNFLGHDIHLLRLDEDTDTGMLEQWMDWTQPEAYISPAPEGMTFLGGVQEMAAGKTAYFRANLVPGKYALVAEVPDALKEKMLVIFDVVSTLE